MARKGSRGNTRASQSSTTQVDKSDVRAYVQAMQERDRAIAAFALLDAGFMAKYAVAPGDVLDITSGIITRK